MSVEYHPLVNVSLPGGRFHPFNLPTVAWNPWTDVRRRDDISRLNISFPFGQMPGKHLQQKFNEVKLVKKLSRCC